MSNLSRRSLVASAAAFPALAVPAFAFAASTEPDPIYAAIQECVEAERADAKAIFKLEEARERFKKKYGVDEPDGIPPDVRDKFERADLPEVRRLIGIKVETHAQLDEFIWKCLPSDVGPETTSWLHDRLGEQITTFSQMVKPFEMAHNEAWARFDEAFQTMLSTVPTTPTGLAALLACLCENRALREILEYDCNYIGSFVETLAAATAKFAKLTVQS
jgi:hypothetical protein